MLGLEFTLWQAPLHDVAKHMQTCYEVKHQAAVLGSCHTGFLSSLKSCSKPTIDTPQSFMLEQPLPVLDF